MRKTYVKGIQVFDANGRYIDVIFSGAYGYTDYDMAFNDQNDLFVVGGKSQIYKLTLNKK